MKTILFKDIKDKSPAELKQLMDDLAKDRLKLRVQSNADNVVKTHHFKIIRKNIARIKTFLAEGASK